MRLRVKLFGHLKTYTKNQSELQREVPAATTLGSLLADLGIPPGEVGVELINGKLANEDTALREGDNVELTPVVSGGAG